MLKSWGMPKQAFFKKRRGGKNKQTGRFNKLRYYNKRRRPLRWLENPTSIRRRYWLIESPVQRLRQRARFTKLKLLRTSKSIRRRDRRVLRRRYFMRHYKRYLKKSVLKKNYFKVRHSRLLLQLALVGWGLIGGSCRRFRRLKRRRRYLLRLLRQRRKRLRAYRLTVRLPLSLSRLATKRRYILTNRAWHGPIHRLDANHLVSDPFIVRSLRDQVDHKNFVSVIKQFNRSFTDFKFRNRVTNISYSPDLRTDMRIFMRAHYKRYKREWREEFWNETSYYYLGSYDRRPRKKHKFMQLSRYARRTTPWLKFLMYQRALYKFNFHRPYLRERPMFKTKRNKLYRLFLKSSFNRMKRPRWNPNKRGGDRSFYHRMLLKKILYPVFGRRVRSHQLIKHWAQRRWIKTSITGRYRLVLNRIETMPSNFATKLGWAPTIEWARHFERNLWYTVSRDFSDLTASFPAESRTLPQMLKFPLHPEFQYRFDSQFGYHGTEAFFENRSKVHELRRGDIIQINPSILRNIKASLRTKPRWNEQVFRDYVDINNHRTSALVLKAPNTWHVRKRDRNNPDALRTLIN